MGKNSTSLHRLCLRTTEGYHHRYRPSLNIQEFVDVLHNATANFDVSEAPVSGSKGKKRARSPGLLSSEFSPRKSIRASKSSKKTRQDEWPEMPYPVLDDSIHVPSSPLSPESECVPLWSHCFELYYSRTPPSDAKTGDCLDPSSDPDAVSWTVQEVHLEKELDLLREGLSVPRTIDLGVLNLVIQGGCRLVATSKSSNYKWLLPVPSLQEDDFDAEDYDLDASMNNVMMACALLALSRRAVLDAALKLILLPDDGVDEGELPFRLHLEVKASIVTPTIFESYKEKSSTNVEASQRRFFHYIYPPAVTTVGSFEGASSIPSLYSTLGPAPALPTLTMEDSMQRPELLPVLLPFQRRSVGWMLSREGMAISPDGNIVPIEDTAEFHFWDRIEEGNHTWYLHRLTGALSPTLKTEPPAFGGILAEEPGLGKTLESISLILLNPAPPDRQSRATVWHEEAKVNVKPVKTTLIVTPPALASQWKDELAAHAPSLKVLIYNGWSKLQVPVTTAQAEEERFKHIQDSKTLKKTPKANQTGRRNKGKSTGAKFPPCDGTEEVTDWCTYVNTFDVVITTYQVLRTDVSVARAAPDRPRREDVLYSNITRPRSPLILVEWYRVFMDEVQMAGGGKTEDMVSLIPRRSSFAVSGTPAKTQVSDLIHVLRFLRVDYVVSPVRIWNRLLQPGFRPFFAKFCQNYAIRTMKATVSNELTIPQQTRYLVGIKMGRIERHVYDLTLEAILLELGLDAHGIAATENWEVDGTLLRSSIRRLRAICTHPQVGQLQRQNDKLFKPGALKSMADVLQVMRDQNWRNLMDDWKSKAQAVIHHAQLKQRDTQDHTRYQNSLDILLSAQDEVQKMIAEIEAVMTDHRAKGEILKQEAAASREEHELGADIADDHPLAKGKGKDREESPSSSSEYDYEDKGMPRTTAGIEHGIKRRALQQRLRETRIVLHRAKFLLGDVYHMLGNAYAAHEAEAYGDAEEIRRNLLKTTEEEAMKGMNQLDVDATKNGITSEDLQIPVPFLEQGGICTAEDIEELHEIIESVLNEQSALLWTWRSHIHSLLTQNLTTGGDEADGQEYQRNLDNQGEAETYLQAYTALLADRREAVFSERTVLAAHDAREKKLRHTKAAMKAAATEVLEDVEDVELQPEHEVLRKELMEQRRELLAQLNGRAMKSTLVQLTGTATKITKDSDPEKVLVRDAIASLRKLINEQGAIMMRLEADLALFRKAFNQRILYFRQLQEISDSVSDVVLDRPLQESIEDCWTAQTDLTAKINTSRARQRYLDNLVQLSKNREDKVVDEDEECCILCRCNFLRGFITQCAHVFCEDCLKAWLLKKDGKACPVCRVPIDSDNLQRFTVDEHKQNTPSLPLSGEPAPKSRRAISYNMIDPKVLEEIETMESFGDFGNKIQSLIRHLLYIQRNDPGAKSIVFSAWADSLSILQRALNENGILCLRIDQAVRGEGPAKKFRTDPEIPVLLLHGERENAGLNITCASRVFLLESVVHHGFELQAIARIDRMGQTRATEVYCYYAEGTVEKNILDLAARQGLSLYTKENAAGSLDVSSFAVDAEKKKVDSSLKRKLQKGDFISKIEDMLAILFPHMYEDVEYLVPENEDFVMDSQSSVSQGSAGRSREHVDAEAGPSRLPMSQCDRAGVEY